MSALRAWVHRVRHRALLAPPEGADPAASLGAAVLGRAGPYLWHRLRRPVLRAAVKCAIHGADFSVLVWVLRHSDPEALPTVLLLKFVSLGVADGVWWLAEPLRARARDEAPYLRDAAVPLPLALARTWAALALFATLAALALTARGALARQLVSVAELYGLAVALDLGVSIGLEARGARLRALQRVYRPALSFWGPDLFSVVGTVALWWVVGPWAPGLAFLLSTLLRSGLRARYLTRALRVEALLPRAPSHASPRAAPPPPPPLATRARALAAALASGVRGALFAAACGTLAGNSGFGFTVLPLALLAYGAPRLFYTDLAQAQPLGDPVRARVLRIAALAQRVGTAIFALGVALGVLAYGGAVASHAAGYALLVLFVASQGALERACLALALARRWTAVLAVSCAGLAASLLVVVAGGGPTVALAVTLVAGLAIAALGGRALRTERTERTEHATLTHATEWTLRPEEPGFRKRQARERLRAEGHPGARSTRDGVRIERASQGATPPDWLAPLVRAPARVAPLVGVGAGPARFALTAFLARCPEGWALDRDGRVHGVARATGPVSLRALASLFEAADTRERSCVRYEAGALWVFPVAREGGARELLIAPRAGRSREAFRALCFALRDEG